MKSEAADAVPPWWVDAFGALYPIVYGHRDESSAAAEVEFGVRACGAIRGARVLDVGCGAGRHARALAAAGMRVVGVDLSLALLASAQGAGGGPRYLRADFRALPFAAQFDHAFSFFSSFGYFDDAGNAAHLRSLRSALRPRGTLLLDFLNAPQVVGSLVPRSERIVAGLRAVERRSIVGGRVEKAVEAFDGDRAVGHWRESVRLYGRDEVTAMLAACGLIVTQTFGSLAGAPWSDGAARLVLMAEAR